jgi:ornithine carbamoyltransferase
MTVRSISETLLGRDFISIRDFSGEELRHLLVVAAAIKAHPTDYQTALKGKTLAMILEKPSLRTRVTFDVGVQQLGGFSLYLSPPEINLGRRETIHDVAKNLERMVQGIMIRTFEHRIVEEMARHATIPVINGLTDFSHPCQALADYLTIQEVKGRLDGIKVAYVGDGNNVANSLMFAAARLGAHIAIASPPGYGPRPEASRWAQDHIAWSGARCLITEDPREAVEGADIVYTDVWASMGQDSEAAERRRVFRPYQVNLDLLRHANRDAVFMHCLPAHRGDEVTDDVIDSPQSVVFQQAENRLHVQKAVMCELMK